MGLDGAFVIADLGGLCWFSRGGDGGDGGGDVWGLVMGVGDMNMLFCLNVLVCWIKNEVTQFRFSTHLVDLAIGQALCRNEGSGPS